MQSEELIKLIREVQRKKCETQTIELKSAEKGCPTKIYDTISAFSNQDTGGVIIFGVNENEGFAVKGVYDAHDLQKKITEQCKQMEPVVRPLFTTCIIDEKIVVSAEIPGSDISDRPIYYKGVGRIKGSYIRVGESDELMSEYEIYSFEAFRKRIRDELRKVDNYKISLFNRARLEKYLERVKQERPNLIKSSSDKDILEMMGVTNDGIPRIAGLLVFSDYPQAYFPQLSITAVSLPGTSHGTLGDDGERFIDNKRMTGSISDMLSDAVEFVRKNSKIKTIINEYGERIDKPEYPLRAVREAILNALVHRDYSRHTENVPIRIEMYRDRMEIVNSGGLYGKITIDALGKVRPDTRNAALANVLELLGETENRYSGIPTIRNEFANANLPSPIFSVERGEFKVVMKNSFGNDTESLMENILNFCSVPRSREELISFIGKSRNFVMSQIIHPLVNEGKLRLTLPDKPKSSLQKYVKVN